MTTVIITTTLASLKFWPATTSAAAVFRWAVPNESTPRVSAPGPPSTQPMPKQRATKIKAATIPNEPRMLAMLPRCPAVVSTTTKIMLMLEMGATNALMRPAAGGCHARSASPTASGISISRMRDRAMLAGFTDTPSSSSGRTTGMNPAVTTISTTIRPTANGMSPFASSASLRRKGAPPARPTNSSPIPSGSSRPSTLVRPIATIGASTKFASRERTTSRPFRSGARICGTVSASPTDSVLDTTKTTTDAFAPLISSSVNGMAFALCSLCHRGGRLVLRLDTARTVREKTERPNPRQKEVGAALHGGKCGQPRDLLFDRPFRNRHVVRAVMRTDEGIPLVAELVELGVVGPDVLRELVLPDQTGAADKGGDTPFDSIFGSTFRQRRPVRSAATNDAPTIHVHGGVARVHAPDVGAEWDRVAVRVHLSVIEVVVALWIRRQLGVVLRWRKHERCAAAPPAHQLRRD